MSDIGRLFQIYLIKPFLTPAYVQIKIGKVRWQAVGKFDLRGLRGEAGTARFQEINLIGEVSPFKPNCILRRNCHERHRHFL